MKILTASETKQLESLYMEQEHVASIDLMERAAKALFEKIITIKDKNTPVKVFAGSHNNGGDALAVSRLLSQAGYAVEVFLFNTKNNLSTECQTNRDRILSKCPKIVFHEISKKLDLPPLTENDLIIDGLFGIGLNGPISGAYALLIKYINNSAATVVSIDIPSGMMAENNQGIPSTQVVHAHYTLSIQSVKPAFLFPDCQQYIGQLSILDIGMENTQLNFSPLYHVNTLYEMRQLLHPRSAFSHKGTFGHGLLIAGSYGMAGAAVLASQAAMRSGIGKLTVHVPALCNNIIQSTVPQAVVHIDDDNYLFSSSENTDAYQAVAVGPGLGTKNESGAALMAQITHTSCPLLIDADGLNILAQHTSWMQQLPKDTILTPHVKEFERLFGVCQSFYEMISKASEAARALQIYIVLKDHFTFICCPDGNRFVNANGNSGMATAGSGDVLTGIILSLLAQGYTPIDACRMGCYLHGLSGSLAADELTEEAMNVLDIIQYLPKAFKLIKNKS